MKPLSGLLRECDECSVCYALKVNVRVQLAAQTANGTEQQESKTETQTTKMSL